MSEPSRRAFLALPCRLRGPTPASDAQDWIARGYASMSLTELTLAYRCSRIGCKLQFDERYANGLPLQTFVGGAETAMITCNRCMRVTTLSVERLIQRLVRTGAGDGNAGCNVFAAAIKTKALGRFSKPDTCLSRPYGWFQVPNTPAERQGVGGLRRMGSEPQARLPAVSGGWTGLRLKRPRRNVSAATRDRQPGAAAPNEIGRWTLSPTRCSMAGGCGR